MEEIVKGWVKKFRDVFRKAVMFNCDEHARKSNKEVEYWQCKCGQMCTDTELRFVVTDFRCPICHRPMADARLVTRTIGKG